MASIARRIVARFLEAEGSKPSSKPSEPLETTADLLAKIKKLDVQIKHCTDIGRRKQWVMSRNQMVGRYNKLTGKTPDRGVTNKLAGE